MDTSTLDALIKKLAFNIEMIDKFIDGQYGKFSVEIAILINKIRYAMDNGQYAEYEQLMDKLTDILIKRREMRTNMRVNVIKNRIIMFCIPCIVFIIFSLMNYIYYGKLP